MIQILGSVDWEFKRTTINMLRELMKKSVQHARTGG